MAHLPCSVWVRVIVNTEMTVWPNIDQTVRQLAKRNQWQSAWMSETLLFMALLCGPGHIGDSGDHIHHLGDFVPIISYHEGEYWAGTRPPTQCGRSQERRTQKIDPDSSDSSIPSRIWSGYSIPEVSLSISICQSSSLCVCTLYLHLCLQP